MEFNSAFKGLITVDQIQGYFFLIGRS